MRQALRLAFAVLLLAVTATLLIASYVGTRTLARQQAGSLMAGVQRETEVRLHRIFDPIHQKVLEDYAGIRIGRYTTKAPTALKDRLYPNLFALPQVDSLMVGDLTGSQFLVMRYTPAVLASSLLAPVAAELPAPPSGAALQFFTRDFRPADWGENSHWTLWDEVGRTAVRSWELPLPGYDGRRRPWHRAAMARFADIPLDQAHQAGDHLVAWTDVYPLFTTGKPGISASIAGRDPAGRVLIVAYDLLLDEIAQFTSSARPSAHGQLLVLTDDGRLLGPPRDDRPDAETRRAAALIQPLAPEAYPTAATAVAEWQRHHGRAAGRFPARIDGAVWWSSFAPFEIGAGRLLWVGVLVPETDLVPAAVEHQRTILVVGGLALVLAFLVAGWLARRFGTPLAALAGQARRLAELDLSPSPEIQSPIAELAALSRTIAETRESLRQRIAERENARLALAESERQQRTLTENTPDIIIRFDARTRHLFVNPAHARATGFAPDQVLGRTLAEVDYPSGIRQGWQALLDGVFANDEPARLEFEYPTPAGARFFEARILPEPSAAPGHRTALAVVHDISERVAAATALQRSEARYRTLIESALVGIVVHQDGFVRFANPAALQLFGWGSTSEDIRHVRWDSVVDPSAHAEIAARCAEALAGHPPPLHPGWRFRRHDGGFAWVQSSVTAIEWDGRPACLSFLRDITDLRAAAERERTLEEQLRHAQKLEAVGLLAGGIAHDFNNLLQIIGGNAQFADDPDVPDADRRACLQEINKTVQRASQMTRQLLAFSRRQALCREETELNAFVADHVQMIRRLIPETITLDLVPAPAPLRLQADRGQLEQVFLNLCLNARDAMPKGGTLTIRLDSLVLAGAAAERRRLPAGKEYIRIVVSDTGHGMDPSVLDRIFDPFFTTKARDKGTGLGLAVVYGIVRQHEGHIEAASAPGRGTQFTIHLPLRNERGAQRDHPTAEAAAPHHAGGTILLAEDNEPIRRIAVTTLERAGYRVQACADGRAAVECFQRDPAGFDLLFFDVMMPNLTGFEAARLCRQLRPEIPVIFASGYAADSVDQDESIPEGAHLLQKPYRAESLLQLVARMLAARRS